MTIKVDGDFKYIKFEISDQIGVLKFNRPDKLNALNQDLLRELHNLLEMIVADRDFQIRGLILTGEGDKAFVAGADIAEMANMTQEEARRMGHAGQQVTQLFEDLTIPVIAAVNGFALGGGCEMAMSADFILATKSAVFGQPEVKLGLIPGFGGTQRLSRIIGRNRAKEIIYSGRNVTAQEALNMGLVVALYETKDELLDAARKMLEKMKGNSPVAIAAAKRVMNEANDLHLREALAVELAGFSHIFESEDMREGTAAFMEKRKPVFQGK